MDFKVKNFTELTISELYAFLQLRAAVFVVEQDCPYQDVDGKDQKALHILGYEKDRLIAYTRVFEPGAYFENASIGRVVVKKDYRGSKNGKFLMEESIKAIQNHFNVEVIEISAQKYLLEFYKELDFESTGSEYLEDNIPHLRMIRNKKPLNF